MVGRAGVSGKFHLWHQIDYSRHLIQELHSHKLGLLLLLLLSITVLGAFLQTNANYIFQKYTVCKRKYNGKVNIVHIKQHLKTLFFCLLSFYFNYNCGISRWLKIKFQKHVSGETISHCAVWALLHQDGDGLIHELCQHICCGFVKGYAVPIKCNNTYVWKHWTAACIQTLTQNCTLQNSIQVYMYSCTHVCRCVWLTWTVPFWAAFVSIDQHSEAK